MEKEKLNTVFKYVEKNTLTHSYYFCTHKKSRHVCWCDFSILCIHLIVLTIIFVFYFCLIFFFNLALIPKETSTIDTVATIIHIAPIVVLEIPPFLIVLVFI